MVKFVDENQQRIYFPIESQPTEASCGPTCLAGLYAFYNDPISLSEVIGQIGQLPEGGTLATHLGDHALRRGYQATIYSYNLMVFDPTWFGLSEGKIHEKLKRRLEYQQQEKRRISIQSFIDYIELGGRLKFAELKGRLLQKYLKKGIPILTGLSATYLYHTAREFGPENDYNDIQGEPAGHFVVLSGYNKENRTVYVADPLSPNPIRQSTNHYSVGLDRLICAILLGVLTHDANLLVIEPKG